MPRVIIATLVGLHRGTSSGIQLDPGAAIYAGDLRETQLADPHADEPERGMADGSRHLAHLVVFPLYQLE